MDAFAEVVHGLDGRIIGVQVPVTLLDEVIHQYEEWFIQNGLFCLAESERTNSPCIRVLKREDSALSTVWGRQLEAVVLNRSFYREEVDKPTFPELMKNIRKYYHDRVIIDGCRSTWEFSVLQDCGVWGFKNYMYRPISVNKLETLF